jgi:hypothetical protein
VRRAAEARIERRMTGTGYGYEVYRAVGVQLGYGEGEEEVRRE